MTRVEEARKVAEDRADAELAAWHARVERLRERSKHVDARPRGAAPEPAAHEGADALRETLDGVRQEIERLRAASGEAWKAAETLQQRLDDVKRGVEALAAKLAQPEPPREGAGG